MFWLFVGALALIVATVLDCSNRIFFSFDISDPANDAEQTDVINNPEIRKSVSINGKNWPHFDDF